MNHVDLQTYNKPIAKATHHGSISSTLKNVKETNPNTLLLKYSEVLERSTEYGVKMEDLNTLQNDLEQLLSTCVVKKRLILQFDFGDRDEEIIEKHEQESSEKLAGKPNFINEINLHKRLEKHKKRNSPSTSCSPKNARADPNNDDMTDNNIWLYTKPYFNHVTESDLAVSFTVLLILYKLIQECGEEVYVEKPDLDTNRRARRCPWFNQEASFFPEMEEVAGDRLEEKDVPENNQLSTKLDKCVQELASVNQSNIHDLLKLRVRVAEQLSKQ